MLNEEICHCKKVTVADIERAMHEKKDLEGVESNFEHVKDVTKCSTGCGGCYESVLDVISQLLNS